VAAPGLDPRTEAFWRSREGAVFANPRDPRAAAAAQAVAADAGGPSEAPGAPGLVHFLTSGSSGHPKVIGFTREALLASARAVNTFLGVTAADVWLRVLPRFHVGGFQVEARAWAAGAACVSRDDPWDPGDCARLCAAERVTHVSLVPTQVFDLVRAGLTAPASLRTVLVGGGELRPALHDQARALGWPVRAGYGLTEAASTVAAQAAGEPDCTRLTLLPHWQAATDAEGVLSLRGPALPRVVGRWDETGRLRWEPVVPPLRTTDRVHLDGSTLVFLGRADRVVKRLGELVDLAHVDRMLADAALAAGVFGRVRVCCEPDPRAGHRLVLECLDPAEGAAVAARFDAAQPAFARLGEIRVVDGWRVSELGKPLA
jgi:O-succinylbenzoic acid--CoA ligase